MAAAEEASFAALGVPAPSGRQPFVLHVQAASLALELAAMLDDGEEQSDDDH